MPTFTSLSTSRAKAPAFTLSHDNALFITKPLWKTCQCQRDRTRGRNSPAIGNFTRVPVAGLKHCALGPTWPHHSWPMVTSPPLHPQIQRLHDPMLLQTPIPMSRLPPCKTTACPNARATRASYTLSSKTSAYSPTKSAYLFSYWTLPIDIPPVYCQTHSG